MNIRTYIVSNVERRQYTPFFKSTDVNLLLSLVCFSYKNGRFGVMIGQIACQSKYLRRVNSMNTHWPFVTAYPKSKEEFCVLIYTEQRLSTAACIWVRGECIINTLVHPKLNRKREQLIMKEIEAVYYNFLGFIVNDIKMLLAVMAK